MIFETPPSRPEATGPHRPGALQTVQALRGVAALMVVLFHAAAIWRDGDGPRLGQFIGPWDQGYAGVDLFFVISGFIMVWVAGERPAGAGTAARFLRDRALRIYPLWWVFCTVMAAYFWLSYGQPASPAVVPGEGAWRYFGASLALWPQADMPVLQVGWTLAFEMVFYLVFAALLLLPPRWRAGGLLFWAGYLVSGVVRGDAPPMPGDPIALLGHPLCLEFLLGAAAALALRREVFGRGDGAWLVVGAGVVLAIWLVAGLDPNAPTLPTQRVFVFGIPAAVGLLGLVLLERQGAFRIGRGLAALGDSSYSLYLSHFITLLAIKRIAGGIGPLAGHDALSLALFMVLGTGLSLAVGYAAYRVLEAPMVRAARRLKSGNAQSR